VNATDDTQERERLLKELAKCRCCRFCLDVCPTYQASKGVASFSSFGRLQILKSLLNGSLEFDDSLTYCMYSCLQCRRCENMCKSKGQNLDLYDLFQEGRRILSRRLAMEGKNAKF
jgi:Fe-S oxidoreductase